VAFHQFGKTVKFPRNDDVDIHVREVTLNAEAPSGKVECVEIREFIKEGEVFGHGIVLPLHAIKDLQVALQRLTAVEKKDWAK
jgi:hypothetical protein